MTKMTLAMAGLALVLVNTQTRAFDRDARDDFGWGARYNAHLSEYDGRPLGPPLPALPPCYQYYNNRLIRVPYCYQGPHLYGPHGPAQVGAVHVGPQHVTRTHRAARARSAHRQR